MNCYSHRLTTSFFDFLATKDLELILKVFLLLYILCYICSIIKKPTFMENAKRLVALYVTEDNQLAVEANIENPVEVLGMLEIIKNNLINNISQRAFEYEEADEEVPAKSEFKSKYEA